MASIYGMNFSAMPELQWQYTLESGAVIPIGYIFAVVLMVLCSGLTILIFRFKKWL
ncbi:MAG: CorA family divalent cation transporter [Rikenellaceae bacterium]